MELIASGIAKAKRSLRFQKLLLSFLSYGCWQERNTSILIYYIGLIKWGRVDGGLLQNQMVQVGLLCFKHFPSSVLKVQTKAVPDLGWSPRISLPKGPSPVSCSCWTGVPDDPSTGFLCPLILSHKALLTLSLSVWLDTNWGIMSFSDCLDPDKRSLSLASQVATIVLPPPSFPKCIGQRPLHLKS